MKFLRCLLLLLVFPLVVRADFEGKIVWSMKAELADPQMKAELEAAQQQMNSPQMKAQLEEARQAMESPEMRAMMAQNPQMKAMMEKQMEMLAPKSPAAKGGGMGGGLFPTGMTMHLKGTDTLTTTEGGMMPRDVLSLGAKEQIYMIDRAGQTYAKLPEGKAALPGGGQTTYKVTKTSQTEKILGNTCTRYEVVPNEAGSPGEGASFTVWVAPAIKGLSAKQFRSIRMGEGADAGFMNQIDGVPLRIAFAHPQARMTMEVVSIKEEALAASLFTVPAGFRETAPMGGRR